MTGNNTGVEVYNTVVSKLFQKREKLGKELIWNHESRSESLSDELSAALRGKMKELRI